MSFFSWLMAINNITITHRYQQIQIQMKLTTVKQANNQKGKPISNVFRLKQMIQKAANNHTVEDKENYRFNAAVMTEASECQGKRAVKMLKSVALVGSQTDRSRSEVSQKTESKANGLKLQLSNLNLGKLKINPVMASSVKSARSVEFKPTNFLVKSKSNKTISNKRIQGLSKSIRCQSGMREQLSIDSFRLGRKLGKGRFGNVYAAQQKHNNFILAIKIINKKQLKQAQMQDQLLSEIKLQCYMRHPNILAMYGYFHDEHNIYLMLELADECLFKDLRRKSCFGERDVAYYCRQIVEGLKYLHSESIIHRDLKPENIMVVNNVIKLADFGWSVYSPLYKRQTFCGTLDYVPPEIVKGDFYDQRVDVWSLGILIFELTFGYAPFQGCNTEDETFQRIINGEFEIPDHASESLKRVIKYILIGDPRQRLNLSDIEESSWLKTYEKEGRSISEDIWDFWQRQKAN